MPSSSADGRIQIHAIPVALRPFDGIGFPKSLWPNSTSVATRSSPTSSICQRRSRSWTGKFEATRGPRHAGGCSSYSHGCPCGYLGDARRECTCTQSQITRYRRRISGPLLDRIDVHVEVPRVKYEEMAGDARGEPSKAIGARITKARRLGAERLNETGKLVNAEMSPKDVGRFCQTDRQAESLLRDAHHRLQLSGRGFHRVLKIARTIADLDDVADRIGVAHLAEALQYRARAEV